MASSQAAGTHAASDSETVGFEGRRPIGPEELSRSHAFQHILHEGVSHLIGDNQEWRTTDGGVELLTLPLRYSRHLGGSCMSHISVAELTVNIVDLRARPWRSRWIGSQRLSPQQHRNEQRK